VEIESGAGFEEVGETIVLAALVVEAVVEARALEPRVAIVEIGELVLNNDIEVPKVEFETLVDDEDDMIDSVSVASHSQ
jgi:D-serine deaminase-like pyridoxal phosphate-dependent protein